MNLLSKVINRYCLLFRSAIPFRRRFLTIGKGVVFGRMNSISGHECIEIGNMCVFGNNLRLEAISCWGGVAYTPHVVFEDGVFINQNFHCTCASSIIIGQGTSITANCGIFDIIHPYEDINVNPRNAQIETKPIRIGKECMIGMNSVILPGTVIGNHCVVGANSTVKGVFLDYCVIAGSPAKVIKKFDFETNQWYKI